MKIYEKIIQNEKTLDIYPYMVELYDYTVMWIRSFEGSRILKLRILLYDNHVFNQQYGTSFPGVSRA